MKIGSCGAKRNVILKNCEEIVEDYTRYCQADADVERNHYANCESLEKAIEKSSLAEKANGKMHSHQCRLGKETTKKIYEPLMHVKHQLMKCSNFDELYDCIRNEILEIDGIGELMVYDTAFRLGAYLRVHPNKVYLHSGTREGANALGLGYGKQAIEVSELPN